MHTYSIMFGLTGQFFQYAVNRDEVLIYNVDDRTSYTCSRDEFAALLKRARNDKSVSIVRWS